MVMQEEMEADRRHVHQVRSRREHEKEEQRGVWDGGGRRRICQTDIWHGDGVPPSTQDGSKFQEAPDNPRRC